MTDGAPVDLQNMWVVSSATSPLVPVASIDSGRSDVDLALDDVFGDVDNEGPGITDAVLVAGGSVAVVASQLVALPGGVLVGGIAALGLGAVIPTRSLIRRVKRLRRDHRLQALIGDGIVLDSRPPIVTHMIELHNDIFDRSNALTDVQQLRMRNAAHGLLVEVASLLDGRKPTTPHETEYCEQRLCALQELAELIDQVVQTNQLVGRAEAVAGRREVEAVAGHSALDEAQELASDLRGQPDG